MTKLIHLLWLAPILLVPGATVLPRGPLDRGAWPASFVDAPSEAQQQDREPARDAESAGLNRLWRMMWRRHSGSALGRNHASVKTAFREVIAAPSKSTVRILCKGKQVALGTVVHPDGFVLTKASELTGAVTCALADGTRYDARLVNDDLHSDLAMLKIEAEGLPAVQWSADDWSAPGSWVATPGDEDIPLGIGVVSAQPHRVRGGMLGIVPVEGTSGPRIQAVFPDSGAEAAGLRPGDTITHVNGESIRNRDSLISYLATFPPGEKVRVTILRDRDERQVTVELGERSGTLGKSNTMRFQDRLGGPLSDRREAFAAVLEHDTVLLPNQCGGPLVNLDGQAVGINIARASRVSSYALPADEVRALLPSLMQEATTAVSHPAEVTEALKPVLP